MKIGVTSIFIFLCIFAGQAQDEVSWDIQFDANSSQIIASASIDDGWHLYSTEKVSELGPIPTEFEFESTEGIEFIGSVVEPEPIVAYDANFDETLYYFEKQVEFVQNLKVTSAERLEGIVTYMVCNEEMCMPPVDYKFTIELTHEN